MNVTSSDWLYCHHHAHKKQVMPMVLGEAFMNNGEGAHQYCIEQDVCEASCISCTLSQTVCKSIGVVKISQITHQVKEAPAAE
jgi:hypothetical protein